MTHFFANDTREVFKHDFTAEEVHRFELKQMARYNTVVIPRMYHHAGELKSPNLVQLVANLEAAVSALLEAPELTGAGHEPK